VSGGVVGEAHADICGGKRVSIPRCIYDVAKLCEPADGAETTDARMDGGDHPRRKLGFEEAV